MQRGIKMKKKNELSVMRLYYRKLYYLTHPWKLVKDIYWNIRNFIHRGRYGYAYSDVWNWFGWWTQVGAESLKYLAEYGHGYPGYEPWETSEKWHTYLKDLADKLEWCLTTTDIGCHEDTNEYQIYYDDIHERCRKSGKKDGMYCTWLETTSEEDEIIHKYWDREEELSKKDDKKRAEIFAEIGRLLPRFWD